jgi:hypothetical protein
LVSGYKALLVIARIAHWKDIARRTKMSNGNRLTKLLTVFVAATLACPPTWADRGYGHGGYGSHGDGGWGWGWGLLLGTAILLDATQPRNVYYPAPVYAAPPVYVQPPIVMSAPVTYAAVPSQQPAITEQSWWYYCNSSASYYPYVRNCPDGWTRVSPVPPGQ